MDSVQEALEGGEEVAGVLLIGDAVAERLGEARLRQALTQRGREGVVLGVAVDADEALRLGHVDVWPDGVEGRLIEEGREPGVVVVRLGQG